jgi:hypothetical protein
VAAAFADAWNASSVPADRFAELTTRLDELTGKPAIGKQVQVWLREEGLDASPEVVARYEDAGADTLIFVLDDERDPDTIGRLATLIGRG